MDDSIQKRGQAIEEAFFHERDKQLLEKLRLDLKKIDVVQALASATGITDTQVLSQIAQCGINQESILALSMIPLVHVAWADGIIQPNERDAVIKAASASHLDAESSGLALLKSWLTTKPDRALIEAWKNYMHALRVKLDGAAYEQMKNAILLHAEEVAHSAGGFLGFNAISETERKSLAELKEALAV